MLDGIEALFHPATWVILAILGIGTAIYGFASGTAESIWGPNPEKVRQECIQRAHVEKESCVNGGVGGSLFKTKGRIAKCDEIMQRDVRACG